MENSVDKIAKNFNRADHLANERTFLAWIRTNLGIMAFGFVVEKFSFFIAQIAAVLGKSGTKELGGTPVTLQGYSSVFGISLVGIGAIFCIFALLKFQDRERQINRGTYKSSSSLNVLLGIFVLCIGVFLVAYLILNSVAVS